jgi:hypothetical protein
MMLKPLTDEISKKYTMNLHDMTVINSEGSNEIGYDEFSDTGTLYTVVWNVFVLGS